MLRQSILQRTHTSVARDMGRYLKVHRSYCESRWHRDFFIVESSSRQISAFLGFLFVRTFYYSEDLWFLY